MNIKTFFIALVISFSFQQFAQADSAHVKIPAGTFKMGCSTQDKRCDKDEGPRGGTSVFVKTFYIDPKEVSVKDYRACIKSGYCQRPKDHTRNQYCNLDAVGRENHPINCVDWQDAVDYCQTKGGRLPFEAEWEKAARAGSTTPYPPYPSSSETSVNSISDSSKGLNISCKQAILDDGKTHGSQADELDGCGEDHTWPRASRAANQYGLYDMHGNVSEWIANWYSSKAIVEYYAKGNLIGSQTGKQRLVRGGSWDENTQNLRSSFRNVKPPISGKAIYGSIGFRCVYDK